MKGLNEKTHVFSLLRSRKGLSVKVQMQDDFLNGREHFSFDNDTLTVARIIRNSETENGLTDWEIITDDYTVALFTLGYSLEREQIATEDLVEAVAELSQTYFS